MDQLSGGRLELIIGKGNDPRHYPLFGIREEEQWDSLDERYHLLRRLWSEENVPWQGTYRPPLDGVTMPYYEAFHATAAAQHNQSPFTDIWRITLHEVLR